MKGTLQWVPGRLYKLGPKHQHYNSFNSELSEKVFLCTKPCVIKYKGVVSEDDPTYALICVDTGGVWAQCPDVDHYVEYL